MIPAYEKLLEKTKEMMVLSSIGSIVSWDFETHMPPGAVGQRALQRSLLQRLIHKRMTDAENETLIREIQSSGEYKDFSENEKRNVFLINREYERATKLPEDFVAEMTKQTTISVQSWKNAKLSSDYSIFQGDLEKNVELLKKKAEYLDPDKDPYDVLIDLFEPGATASFINRVFEPLKKGLIPLIKKCVDSEAKQKLDFINRPVPIEIQRKISDELMKYVNYDLERGRLDETEHPFTNGEYDDVRITTHYYMNKVFSSIYSVLHEAGHGLYEQNLPSNWWWQPIGNSCSMGIHESQSRFVENIIGRSLAFWTYFYDTFKEITGDIFNDIDVYQVVRAVNDVKPSKIRIEADEVTYSLHVILRFEIENDIMHDKITVSELPQVWNQKMKDYFDIDVENDSEGVLQDTHWASGYIGYFPTYALGNVYDGMLLEKLMKEIPGWKDKVSSGNFKTILDWLVKNVHKHGNTMDPLELIKFISDREIDSFPFIKYLEKKINFIYNL